MFCCECGSEMRLTGELITEVFHGEEFTVSGIERHVCDACGNDVMSADMATKLATELARMYAEKMGMLAPEEIRDIRKGLGLTQAEFERLVGVSSPTVCRWERGVSLQSKSADLLLRLIRDVPNVARYLAQKAGIHIRVRARAIKANPKIAWVIPDNPEISSYKRKRWGKRALALTPNKNETISLIPEGTVRKLDLKTRDVLGSAEKAEIAVPATASRSIHDPNVLAFHVTKEG